MDRTEEYLKNSTMIFAVTNNRIQKNELDKLRKVLPNNTFISVVKNGPFRRVLDGTYWEPLQPLLKENNLYFFIPEGNFRDVYNAYQSWRDDLELKSSENDLKFACVQGGIFVGPDQIREAINIPTKKELMQRLIQVIHNIPVQLTRILRRVPQQLHATLTKIYAKMEDLEKVKGMEGKNATLADLLALSKAENKTYSGTTIPPTTTTIIPSPESSPPQSPPPVPTQ
jgi:ribosomal protein L10